MTIQGRIYTAEELLQFPKQELVDGRLTSLLPADENREAIADWIAANMLAHVKQHGLSGRVYVKTGFVLARDIVREPDVAYVGEENHFPDIAVEVISPNDTYSDVEDQKDRYLAAGARAVVIVDPRRNTVNVHRTSGVTTIADALTLEELPGWSLPLGDLFTAVR